MARYFSLFLVVLAHTAIKHSHVGDDSRAAEVKTRKLKAKTDGQILILNTFL